MACIIAIGGLSGNGKSTLAKNFYDYFNQVMFKNVILLDSDAIRKELWYHEQGVKQYDPKDVLPIEAYSAAFSLQTYQDVMFRLKEQIRWDYNALVIVDATFLDKRRRYDLSLTASQTNSSLKRYWLENDGDVLKERCDTREKGISDANGFVLGLQLKKDIGDLTDWDVVRTDSSAEETFAKALRRVGPAAFIL